MRYFFVSYIYEAINGSGNGSCNVIASGFINRKKFVEDVKGANSFTNVILMSILELSKEDYEQYIKE
jgi:hypothetical protein